MKHDSQPEETVREWSETLLIYFYRARILLKQYMWVFLVTVSICIIYQAYKQLSQPKIYVSTSQMIVSGRISLPEGSLYKEELSNFFGTQIKLMQSNKVQTRARERVMALKPNLTPSPVSLSVSQSPQTSIFILQATGSDPEYTQAYLNAIMEEFLHFKVEMKIQTAESTFISITDKILQLKEEIDILEEKKMAFQEANNLVFIKEQGNIAGAQLSELKNQLSRLTISQSILANFDLHKLISQPSSMELEQLIRNTQFDLDAKDYIQLSSEVNKLEAERDEYLTYMKATHPTIVGLEAEISRKENILRVMRRQILQALIDLKESLNYEIANLKIIIKEWEGKALDFSKRLAEYEQIESKLQRVKKSQDQLLSSTQSIDVNKNLDQESLSILESASPSVLLKKNILREIIVGFVFGIFLGGAVIAAIATIDSRIYSVEDITNRYEEPVIGVVPNLEGEEANILLQKNDDRVLFAEALRNIRSSVIYLNRESSQPKTFLIASSIPSEGKSTIASNLAIALAFSVSKTLLVDADLRKGRLAGKFNLPKSPGLSEAINQTLKPEVYIQKTSVSDLDIITSGETPENPSEILLSSKLEGLLADWKELYDFIIFDSAPFLATNDSINLAGKLDGILFVMRASVTRTRQAKSAMRILQMHGPPIYGYILNGVETKGPHYHYYKYSDYY